MKRIVDQNINTKEHWTEVYDKSGTAVTIIQQYRYQFVANHISDESCKLVDLGCGQGVLDLFIKHLRPLTEITGVDLYARGKGIQAEMNGTDVPLFENFVEGDVCDTGLADEYFDYAISLEVLEHLDNPTKLADEMYRILKKDGKAMLTTPLLNRLPSGEHVWEFSLEDVKKMFEDAGFKKVWVIPFASGGSGVDKRGNIVNPYGTWDEIWMLACKGEL